MVSDRYHRRRVLPPSRTPAGLIPVRPFPQDPGPIALTSEPRDRNWRNIAPRPPQQILHLTHLTVKLLGDQAVKLSSMTGKKRQVATSQAAHYDDDEIGRVTRNFIRTVDHYRQQHAERTGTGVTELLAMGHLYHEGDLSPTELAERLDLTTGSVTALVNRLVKAGHAERHAHPEDRRRLVITLTRPGVRIIAGLFSGLRDATAGALNGATPRHRRIVAEFVESSTDNLNATISKNRD
jgi:DNA-binding MarR family transcriptional regulator